MLPLFCLLTVIAPAQSATQPAADLADAYVDASYRFSVRPPRNWGVNVQRVLAPGEVLLLQITDPSPVPSRPEIVIKWAAQPATMTAGEYVARFHRMLVDRVKDLTIVADAPRKISGRPAAVFSAQFTMFKKPVVQMIAVVQERPGSFYTITCTGPYDKTVVAQRLFDAVVDSFKLLGDDQTDAALRAALTRTRNWTDELKSVRLSDRVQPPLCLRMTLDGKPRGFLLVTEEPFVLQRTEGVRVREASWCFPDEREARRVENNLFVSLDRTMEAWELRSYTLLPGQAADSGAIEFTDEEGLRDHDVLLTSQSYVFGQAPANNPHVALPAGYVSRLLLRWLPRLVDLSKPALYAATVYDHRRGGLVLRTIEVMGPQGKSGNTFRVLDREGLAAQPVELLVDKSGRLLRMTAGSLVMEPSDLDVEQRRWETRSAAAAKEIDALAAQYAKADSRFAPPPPRTPVRRR